MVAFSKALDEFHVAADNLATYPCDHTRADCEKARLECSKLYGAVLNKLQRRQSLLERVFNLFYLSFFNDHKMNARYLEPIKLCRDVGHDIGEQVKELSPDLFKRLETEAEEVEKG